MMMLALLAKTQDCTKTKLLENTILDNKKSHTQGTALGGFIFYI
jgi:hypothetical protein